MSGPRPQRSSYHQKALQQIRNSIQPFATSEGGSTSSGVSSVSSGGPPSSSPNRQSPNHQSTRAIEYRAQQYPFVPSQVPASVQQLLRRIDSPSSQSSSSSNSPTSQLQPVIKKPALVIKSTVVPKPVLQTAVPYSLPAKPYSASPPPLPPKPNKKPKAEIINWNQEERRNSMPKDVFDPNNRVNVANGIHDSSYEKTRLIVTDIVNDVKNSNFLSNRYASTKLNNLINGNNNDCDDRTNESRNSDSMIYGSVEEFKHGPNSETSEVDSEIVEVTGGANGNGIEPEIHTHESPIPVRKKLSREKEEERFESKVRVYSPQAFKFFMEQHVENVIKSQQERLHRRMQLESEMSKIRLSDEAQTQMRKMLNQKESNYIRLKRAKMDKSLFKQIRIIGAGAFGVVSLVRKLDTQHLFAMKTLLKSDVLRKNHVAHVKAERDILAEADNEWVVKLYYSFQDVDHLYFVMDYIPGGDLMNLLIKKGIFEESLSKFYIAELTCAVESVHKMGFIHRDIKPDNILIDRDGHIKLTDFGLCTGFRWTHNSRYYQEPSCCQCNTSLKRQICGCDDGDKPLERRRKSNVRYLAHSLVGTPNYIAPEVLRRAGYTQLCDWWSVGVILYEMLVGQAPFHADNAIATQDKIINWASTLHIPAQAKISNSAADLILKLCTDQTNRLGKGGAQQVKSHMFFANVDFESGLRRSLAPFVPEIRYETDTSNFDPCDGDRPIDVEAQQYESNQFHGFFEFTFRRFFDDAYNNEAGGPVYV